MPPPARSSRRRWTLRLVLAALVAALVTGFAAQNYDLVDIRLFVWSTEIRPAWALILALLLGLGLARVRL